MSAGNAVDLQVDGAITLEACIKNEADPRPGQRLMPHRNIIAHGHDRVTEVIRNQVSYRHTPLTAHTTCTNLLQLDEFELFANNGFILVFMCDSGFPQGQPLHDALRSRHVDWRQRFDVHGLCQNRAGRLWQVGASCWRL